MNIENGVLRKWLIYWWWMLIVMKLGCFGTGCFLEHLYTLKFKKCFLKWVISPSNSLTLIMVLPNVFSITPITSKGLFYLPKILVSCLNFDTAFHRRKKSYEWVLVFKASPQSSVFSLSIWFVNILKIWNLAKASLGVVMGEDSGAILKLWKLGRACNG